jgi:hypothetical protein
MFGPLFGRTMLGPPPPVPAGALRRFSYGAQRDAGGFDRGGALSPTGSGTGGGRATGPGSRLRDQTEPLGVGRSVAVAPFRLLSIPSDFAPVPFPHSKHPLEATDSGGAGGGGLLGLGRAVQVDPRLTSD